MQPTLSLGSPRFSKLFVVAIAVALLFAQSALAREIPNHTANFTRTAPDMGAADPSQVITVKVHLRSANQDQLSDFIQQLHDPSSPNFQKWLTPEQFKARFGASVGDAANVQNFLVSRNLKVVKSDGRSITVQGTVRDIQNAFQTQIHNFNLKGDVVRANVSNPNVADPAGAAVAAISGLTEVFAQPHSKVARDAAGNPREPMPLAAAGADASTAQCFAPAPASVSISDGVNTATYTGAAYAGCFFQPAELQTAYNFTSLFTQGLDGTGQTIVIVDAFGSPTLAQDVATFDAVFGLPPAQITTFNVNVTGAPPRQNSGFATETTLDVEWAHVVAPNAKIALVLAADNSFTNLNAAVQFAIENHLGPAISNSYGAPENEIDAGTFAATEAVIAEGAAAGVSVNYSSGDDGDFSIDFDPPVTTVSYPSGSPFATSVGGTSLFVNPDNTFHFETGWGLNLAQLNSAATFPFPDNTAADGLGFLEGAGGGSSQVFAKPHFQRSTPGDFRNQPDIAYLADPQTGVEIVITVRGRQVGEIIGGTSLACPLFSALWTIAAQAAGGGNIGQAAQTVYDLHDDAIRDVRQVSSPNNVTGVITGPLGTVRLTAAEISQPLFDTRRFLSALAGGSGGQIFNLTFGTDSSLTVDNGWDNVTGLGTPNAPIFIQRVVKELGKHGNGN